MWKGAYGQLRKLEFFHIMSNMKNFYEQLCKISSYVTYEIKYYVKE